jgi:protease III
LSDPKRAPLRQHAHRARQGVVADYRKDSVLEDSALVELFLDPEPGPRAKARMLLLEGLLSTRFYSQLRTEEQLGYVATSFPVMFAHNAGIGFGVQSPVQGTAGLADRFESFYFRALAQMRAVTEQKNSKACARECWPP